MRRAGKWLGCLYVILMFPLLALSVIAPVGSGLSIVLSWTFAVIFWPGPLVIASAYLIVRWFRHRRIHHRFTPCPWCQREAEYHTLPRAVRDQRDQLRDRLVHSEHHVD